MTNLVYWIWFASKLNIKGKTKRELIAEFGDPKTIYYADEKPLSQIEDISHAEVQELLQRDLTSAKQTIISCNRGNIQILTYQDALYPERLKSIYDPPYVLYVKGALPAIDSEPVIGVVGTRDSSPYGEKMARNLCFELATGGAIIITGLAAGIDSRAAEGALMAGGTVIGVLGTAIDVVYPRYNTRLFDDVIATGAIVSEYPPGTLGSPNFFPLRNRIIAAMSVGVAVVEAPQRSGSLITAHQALDQGKEIFAVPGNVDAKGFVGSNTLIREGATLVTTGWDILGEFQDRFPDRISGKTAKKMPDERAQVKDEAQHEKTTKPETEKAVGLYKHREKVERAKPETTSRTLEDQLSDLTETQLKIISSIGKRGTHIDDIIDVSKLSASVVLSEMTILQIKGVVTQESGKRFKLNIVKRG